MKDSHATYDENWDLIEAYLRNEMNGKERKNFETKLAENADLRKEFDLHKEVHSTLGQPGEHAFRRVLDEIANDWQDRPSVDPKPAEQKRRLSIRIMSIAATAAILLGAIFWLFKPTDGDVFSRHFEPYAMVLTERAPEKMTSEGVLVAEAIKRYDSGNYSDAAASFETLAELNPGALSYLFYAGVSHLASGDTGSAIVIFKSLVEMPDHLLIEQSRWYLALAYMKSGNSELARSTLEEIGPDAYKYKEAQDILQK